MGRGPKTSQAERLAMISWLEKKENFNLITGIELTILIKGKAAKGLVIAGKKLKKHDAYVSLAASINTICNSEWDSKNAKSRYEAYLKNYKETARQSNRTGFGLTEDDKENGIFTIMEKLEHMCPNFNKMDNLFGNRQNVMPSNVQESVLIENDEQSDKENDGDTLEEEEEGLSPKVSQLKTPKNSFLPQMGSSGTSNVKKRDFSTSFLDAKESEITFKKECFNLELALRQKEFELKKQELEFKKKENEKEIIKTLIAQGKTAIEVKEFLEFLNI